jgi:hypothetical protein
LDVIGRANASDWWVAKSTGSEFVNESWGAWAPGSWDDVLTGTFQ